MSPLRATSELCVGVQRALRGRPRERAASPASGESLRGRVVLSSGGGRVRAAGQALPVGVLIPRLRWSDGTRDAVLGRLLALNAERAAEEGAAEERAAAGKDTTRKGRRGSA